MSTRTAPKPRIERNSGSTATESDRRRRARISTTACGYLLPEGAPDGAEPWEVRVHDVSRMGVGFVTSEPMQAGSICRIRIGYGPMRLARRMRVTHCKPEGATLYRIGAEFA